MVLGLTAISGLLQGGGFGIGYGFGVRLGYDAYGGLKEWITGKAQTARYSTNPFVSHLGSGILSALGLSEAEVKAGSPSEPFYSATNMKVLSNEYNDHYMNDFTAQQRTNFKSEFDLYYS